MQELMNALTCWPKRVDGNRGMFARDCARTERELKYETRDWVNHLHYAICKTSIAAIFKANQARGNGAHQATRGHHEFVASFGCHAKGCDVLFSNGGRRAGCCGGKSAGKAVDSVGAKANTDGVAEVRGRR
jgi:hypothetical protein